MKIEDLSNTFGNVIINGNSFVLNRLIDLETLISLRKQNLKYKREDFEYYHLRSNNKIVLANSIILNIFSLFEAYCTFLCYLCTHTNDHKIKLVPPIKLRLSQYEIDYLKEITQKVNKKGEIKIQTAYLPILDKLQTVFIFISKLHGSNYQLDISTKYWCWINELKEYRDNLVHPKFQDNQLFDLAHLKSITLSGKLINLFADIIKNSKQIEIPPQLLYRSAAALRWYYRSTYELYASILKKYSESAMPFLLPEFLMRNIMFTLGKEIGIQEKEIDNEFPALGIMEYIIYEK